MKEAEASELRGIPIPRTPVNKAKKGKGSERNLLL